MTVMILVTAAAVFTAWFVVRDTTRQTALPPDPAPAPPPLVEIVLPSALAEEPHAPEPPLPAPETEAFEVDTLDLEPFATGSLDTEVLQTEVPEAPEAPATLALDAPGNGDDLEVRPEGPAIPFELARIETVMPAAAAPVRVREDLLAPLPEARAAGVPRRALGIPRFGPDPDRLIQSVVYEREGTAPFLVAVGKLAAAIVFFGLMIGVTIVSTARGVISVLGG